MRNARIILGLAAAASAVLGSAAAIAKTPKPVWQVTRTGDPITGATSCVVAAYDKAAGLSFSRTGALYPIVENSSTYGLLVGVSSGGRFRLPTGDILWRVDDRPFRTLAAADSPAGMNATTLPQANAAMAHLVAEQMRVIAAATATSTVASGSVARAMINEMLAGKGLVYRSAAATANYGLPTGVERSVGQITSEGLRPYPLDDSFRAGLAACGISATPAD
jgi:hypothetical protein